MAGSYLKRVHLRPSFVSRGIGESLLYFETGARVVRNVRAPVTRGHDKEMVVWKTCYVQGREV